MNIATTIVGVLIIAGLPLKVAAEGQITVKSASGKPLEGAKIFVWECSGRRWVGDGAASSEFGTARINDVNVKAEYEVVVFCKGYKLWRKVGARFAPPLAVSLAPLPQGFATDIIDNAGTDLFGDGETDLAYSGTFRCTNDKCLIGYRHATVTSLPIANVEGAKFVVKKGDKQAKCELVGRTPLGVVIEYRVVP